MSTLLVVGIAVLAVWYFLCALCAWDVLVAFGSPTNWALILASLWFIVLALCGLWVAANWLSGNRNVVLTEMAQKGKDQ